MLINANLRTLYNIGRAQNVSADNLANIDSTGFKSSTAVQGTDSVSIRPDMQQGGLNFIGNGVNVAINGQGYIPLKLVNGETGYTRNGNFMIDKSGQLTDQAGNPVQPGIRLPADTSAVNIAADGVVTATSGSGQQAAAGQISLATFPNPGALTKSGDGILTESNGSGSAVLNTPGNAGAGSLVFGSLEMSNVDPAYEFVNMIVNRNTFQYNVKAIQVQDDMFNSTLSIKG